MNASPIKLLSFTAILTLTGCFGQREYPVIVKQGSETEKEDKQSLNNRPETRDDTLRPDSKKESIEKELEEKKAPETEEVIPKVDLDVKKPETTQITLKFNLSDKVLEINWDVTADKIDSNPKPTIL